MTARSRDFLAMVLATLVLGIPFIIWAPDAEAATECETFPLEYSVRPGPARAIIGVPVQIAVFDLPDHWIGMPGTVHVETFNSPSVHWNNYLTLTTNGFTTNVYGPEDTANGVRIGDTNIDAIGADLVADYTIGVRDSRDVPGVEGASLEGTVTICATLPDDTTTTSSTTTTTSTSTTIPPSTTIPDTTTTSAPPATSTTAPTDSTTTTHHDPVTPPTEPPGSSTVPPVSTPDPTLPLTGPLDHAGLWLAIGAALTLTGGVLVSRLAVRGEGR